MEQNGMYYVFQLATAILIPRLQEEEFTAQDLQRISGLSQSAISHNLTRLVKIGLLVKIETRDPKQVGRIVKYKINKDKITDITEKIFGVVMPKEEETCQSTA